MVYILWPYSSISRLYRVYIAGISTVFEEYDYKMKAVRSELEEGGSIEGIDISTLPSILIIDTEEADENDSEEYKAIYTLYNLDIEEYGHRIYTKKSVN